MSSASASENTGITLVNPSTFKQVVTLPLINVAHLYRANLPLQLQFIPIAQQRKGPRWHPRVFAK
jgi:hypothetical protein